MKVTTQLKLYKSQSFSPAPSRQSQWQKLVNSLVRPPRYTYSESQMGLNRFILNNQDYTRVEQIVKHNQKSIFVSICSPTIKNNKIILYLHGNSSSKLESKNLLPFLLPEYSLASFDFIGCGNNMQSNVVTLGIQQSKQVQTVVNFLRAHNYKVYIWGRSMGAVSALLYGKVDVIVADSPFRSMRKLCKQLATSKHNPLPNCIVSCLFPCVFNKLKSDIKRKGSFNLDEIDVEKQLKNISKLTTLIFLTGDEDELINHNNSQKLFQAFQGKNKYLEVVKGNHNSQRPQQTIHKIMRIIDQHSQKYQSVSDASTKEQISLKKIST